MTKKRILLASPVHQKPEILNEFLKSICQLKQTQISIDYLFIDDNEAYGSSRLLEKFKVDRKNTIVTKSKENDKYVCGDDTHHWKENLIWKVARFKNMMIHIARKYDYDYLFLIDSDLLLHPNTLEHLVLTEKDIVSNIFWTKWTPESIELPQVWLHDQYSQVPRTRGEKITKEEVERRHRLFLEMLREPGLYEVGGLGACTLISRKALQAGVSFDEIKNITFWGEDRHFCIRAQVLGFELYVDTHYPAYHIYRESDLSGVQDYYNACLQGSASKNHDDIFRVLKEAIENLGTYSYLDGYKKDWAPYFRGEIKNKLLQETRKNKTTDFNNKLIVKASVSDIHIDDENDGTVSFRFQLKNEGLENGKSFVDKLVCSATLERIEGTWFVTRFVTE